MNNIELIKGDITALQVDAIVNAANSSLMGGGGGVDGAIHRKGGKAILEECIRIKNKQGGCATGQAVITTGGSLPAQYVIHTVGPVWNGGNKDERRLLSECYTNCLRLAVEKEISSIAFPNISTGIYRFPKNEAASIAIKAVKELEQRHTFSKIIFVCFDEENYEIYKKLLN